jgi:hypothetical protein
VCFVSPAFGFFGDRWRVNECKLDIGVAQIDMAYYLGQVSHTKTCSPAEQRKACCLEGDMLIGGSPQAIY